MMQTYSSILKVCLFRISQKWGMVVHIVISTLGCGGRKVLEFKASPGYMKNKTVSQGQ